MSTKNLSATSQSNTYHGSIIFSGSDRREAAGNGRAMLIPNEGGKIDTFLVYLKISDGGSGKVQWTIDESMEEWVDWDDGDVITSTSDVLNGVKAVRAVNITGTVELFVRAY